MNNNFVFARYKDILPTSRKILHNSLNRFTNSKNSNNLSIVEKIEDVTEIKEDLKEENIVPNIEIPSAPIIEDEDAKKQAEYNEIFKNLKNKYKSEKLEVIENCLGISSLFKEASISEYLLKNLYKSVKKCKSKVRKFSSILEKMDEREEDYERYENYLKEGHKIIFMCGKIDLGVIENLIKRADKAEKSALIGSIAQLVYQLGESGRKSIIGSIPQVAVGFSIIESIGHLGLISNNVSQAYIQSIIPKFQKIINEILMCEKIL